MSGAPAPGISDWPARSESGTLLPAAPWATAPAAVPDPVCGMTVTPGPAAYPLRHEGATYYFCSAGCHQSFERDPGAYLTKTETRC